jgi:hypothetical protein
MNSLPKEEKTTEKTTGYIYTESEDRWADVSTATVGDSVAEPNKGSSLYICTEIQSKCRAGGKP